MGFGDVTTFKVPERMWFLFLPRIERIERIGRIVSYGDRIDQKVCCFPLGLRPLQPDAYAHPCKRASLSDPPHPSGLPIGRQETNKTK